MTCVQSSIIAFEGLNGVGKTELAKRVARLMGVAYVATPPAEAAAARSLFDKRPFDLDALLFYLAWVKRLDVLVSNRVVVCDRYIASTVAYFRAAGSDVRAAVALANVREPALTVLVLADEELRQQRLAGRPPRVIDRRSMEPDFRDAVLSEYRSRAPRLEVMNTLGALDVVANETARSVQASLLSEACGTLGR